LVGGLVGNLHPITKLQGALQDFRFGL